MVCSSVARVFDIRLSVLGSRSVSDEEARLVDDLAGQLGEFKGLSGLNDVVVGRGDVDNHQSLGVAAQRVLHGRGQHVLVVVDLVLSLALRELPDHETEMLQTRIDGHALFVDARVRANLLNTL